MLGEDLGKDLDKDLVERCLAIKCARESGLEVVGLFLVGRARMGEATCG